MHLSASTIYNVLFFSGIMIVCLCLLLKNWKIIVHLKFHFLFFCLALIILRLLIPVEYFFTTTLLSTNMLPIVNDFLYYTVCFINGYEIMTLHLLSVVWLIGSMIQCGRVVHMHLLLRKIIRHSKNIEDVTQDILADILGSYKRKKPFKLVQTGLSTPMVTGIFQPCILLPDMDLSKEDLTYILKHETAHYFHGDLWIKFIIEVLTIIYWWNPLVYILGKQVSKVLEIHTDFTVTSKLDEDGQIAYLQCLLNIAKHQQSKQYKLAAIPLISENTSTMSQRFHIVLEQETEKKRASISVVALLPMFVIAVLSFCIIFEAHSTAPEDAVGTFELTEENAYLVPNEENGYDVYYNGEYIATVSSMESLGEGVDLPIHITE